MTVLVVLLVLNGVGGLIFLNGVSANPVDSADAIVVLSGDADGREEYGLSLAEEGRAPTVLISKSNRLNDPDVKAACQPRRDIQVICRDAVPFTTRGEALMARKLALENNWKTVLVITSSFHLPRAKKIFEQCFASSDRSAIMREVPRDYSYTVAEWQFNFLYQYGAWAKALYEGDCKSSDR